MNKFSLYQFFYESYVKANPEKRGDFTQSEVNKLWSLIKDEPYCESKAKVFVTKYTFLASKKRNPFLMMFQKQLKENKAKKAKESHPTLELFPGSDQFVEPLEEDVQVVPGSQNEMNTVLKEKHDGTGSMKRVYESPAQAALQIRLNVVESDLVGLLMREKIKQLTTVQEDELMKLKIEKKSIEKKLKSLIANQTRAKKKRDEELVVKLSLDPEQQKSLKIRKTVGRPNLQQDPPLLLEAIADLTTYGAASNEKRRSDELKCIKILLQLTQELSQMGFTISRSGTYLRLLPHRSSSVEG